MNKIIPSMVLVGMLFLVGCQVEYPLENICEVYEECQVCEEPEEPQIAKGKAMLDVEIYDWAINLYNEDEMFFEYWITNYGDSEAKDIKVRCILIDESMNLITSVIDSYGNIASQSTEMGDVLIDTPIIDEEIMYVAQCYVQSCINCDILYERIPELVEQYKDLD